MPSLVGWLDQSEEQQRKMREVIALFGEKNTVDDIGIGVVRDAFSDLLFPGLSTVQTRVRYFLFVPWVYQRLEAERVPSGKADQVARQWEIELIRSLKNGGAEAGVIGINAGDRLKQLPSFIYWNGLRTHGIRLFNGTRADYHRSMSRINESNRALRNVELHFDNPVLEPRWHANLPWAPEDLWSQSTLDLTEAEAEYLQERFIASAPDSLLAHLARKPAPIDDKLPMPWNSVTVDELSPALSTNLAIARYFSEAIHGAPLLYNLMLAEKSAERGLAHGDLVDRYHNELERWQDLVGGVGGGHGISRTDFWATVTQTGANVTWPAKQFIDGWLDLVRDGVAVETSDAAWQLIDRRERTLKKGLSRLGNSRALENWGGASGAGQLTFRWAEGRSAINDLAAGLGVDADA